MAHLLLFDGATRGRVIPAGEAGQARARSAGRRASGSRRRAQTWRRPPGSGRRGAAAAVRRARFARAAPGRERSARAGAVERAHAALLQPRLRLQTSDTLRRTSNDDDGLPDGAAKAAPYGSRRPTDRPTRQDPIDPWTCRARLSRRAHDALRVPARWYRRRSTSRACSRERCRASSSTRGRCAIEPPPARVTARERLLRQHAHHVHADDAARRLRVRRASHVDCRRGSGRSEATDAVGGRPASLGLGRASALPLTRRRAVRLRVAVRRARPRTAPRSPRRVSRRRADAGGGAWR